MKSDRRLDSTEVRRVRHAPTRTEFHQCVAPFGHRGLGVEHQEHRRWPAVAATSGNADVIGDDEFSIAARGNLFHDRPRQTLHLVSQPSQREHEHTATPHVRQDRQPLVELCCIGGWLLLEWEGTDVDPERQPNRANAEDDHV
jgi:hypothetical protein